MEKNFTLTITGTEHGEWQGQLTGEGALQQPFQSLLELIELVNQKLECKARPAFQNQNSQAK